MKASRTSSGAFFFCATVGAEKTISRSNGRKRLRFGAFIFYSLALERDVEDDRLVAGVTGPHRDDDARSAAICFYDWLRRLFHELPPERRQLALLVRRQWPIGSRRQKFGLCQLHRRKDYRELRG